MEYFNIPGNSRLVRVHKQNSVTSWVSFVDDPKFFVFQVRTRSLSKV